MRTLFLSAFLLIVTVSSATAQAVPVKVGIIPIIGAAPVIVAKSEGWTAQEGLDVEIITFESGPNMISALASGTLDVYVAGVAPAAVAASKGVDLKIVAATAIEEMTVVAGAKLAPFFDGKRSAADAFKAYRQSTGQPARLATQPAGSVPNTTLQHWLWEVVKADKADITLVPMGIDATQQALLAGGVEGGTLREPAVTLVQERLPAAKILAYGGDMFPQQPGTAVAISGRFLKAHPEAAQKFVNVTLRGLQALQKDPAGSAKHLQSTLGKGLVSDRVLVSALASKATRFEADPRVIVEPTLRLQAYQVKLGSLDAPLSSTAFFDPSYYLKAVEGKR